MTDVIKVSIKVSKNFRQKIKQMAMEQQLTMNAFCIEMIEIGIKQTADQEVVTVTSLLVGKIVEKFECFGLFAILKTDGFTTSHVVLFEQGMEPPEEVYHLVKETLFAVQWKNEEWPSRQYWIDVAKCSVILWCRTETEKNQLQSTLNRWADELISF